MPSISVQIHDRSMGITALSANKRYRRTALWILLSFATVAILVYWAVVALRWRQTGWDFPVFYIGASLPTHSVYNRAAFEGYWQRHLAPLGVPHWARFVRLPLFSLILRPIAALHYTDAMWLWIILNLCAYFASIGLLMRRLSIPLLGIPVLLAFFPAVAGLISGQDNCVLLLGITAGWVLLQDRRDTLAGLMFALCLYKFNLVVLIPLVLLLHKRFRALSYFAACATLITGISFAITPLNSYRAALTEVPKETAGFFPFGLRGLSLVIGQDWLYPVLAATVFLGCCWMIRRLPLTDAFCLAITGGLLIVPYITWYDSTLLVLPLALIFTGGSTRIRIVCVAVLLLGVAWRFLLMHLGVELFILAYFLGAAAKPIVASQGSSSGLDPMREFA